MKRPVPELPCLTIGVQSSLAFARSQVFYDTTLFWQWMRVPGDIVFAAGALLMAWDFLIKLRPLLPSLIKIVVPTTRPLGGTPQAAE